jgi:hypothetical protein
LLRIGESNRDIILIWPLSRIRERKRAGKLKLYKERKSQTTTDGNACYNQEKRRENEEICIVE